MNDGTVPGSPNAVFRWRMTVEPALMLERWGRPTPISGDHRPVVSCANEQPVQSLRAELERLAAAVPGLDFREEEPETFGHGHLVIYSDRAAARIAFTEVCNGPDDDPDREVTGYRWEAVRDVEGATFTTHEGQAATHNLVSIVEVARMWAKTTATL